MGTIHDLPEEQRPREKLVNQGAQSLTDSELLAIFLRTGLKGETAIEVGQRLLKTFGNLSALARLDAKQLSQQKGLGIAKATQLLACFEMGSRAARETLLSHPIDSSEMLYQLMSPLLIHQKVESLYVISVDTKLNCIHHEEITKGSIDRSIAHPRDIIRPVILNQAAGFFLAHNHPSGDPTPSKADFEVTKNIREVAKLFQITFHDHLIVGKESHRHEAYYSFREEGFFHS